MKSHFTIVCGLLICLADLGSVHTVAAGELLVADRESNSIFAFDETTGEFLRAVTTTGLDQPSSMTLGEDGFLYVSNSAGFPGGAASVVKVNPTTGDTTPFITDVVGPGGVAYHAASDTFFVSEFGQFDGDEVFRYDASGTLMQTLGTGSATTGRTGIAFDADGNLYVNESNFFGVGSVLKFDAPAGDPTDDYAATSTTFASGGDVTLLLPGVPAGGFNGLAFDSAGDLYAVSLGGQSIVKFEVEGGTVTRSDPYGFPVPYPSGIAFGEDGNLLVTSLGNNNPADPFYMDNLFPGKVARFNAPLLGQSPLLVGDLTEDATVDADDLAQWDTAYGDTFAGDLNGDFVTDGTDFLLWQRGFGLHGITGGFQPTAILRYDPAPAAAAVPEPASVAIVLIGGLFLLRHRKIR